MISVAEALAHAFALAPKLAAEDLALAEAGGRVLLRDVEARRSQPPFDASAMDGYAVRNADVAEGAVLEVIGTAAAGARFDGTVGAGQAVRIFTGAPVPPGADRVVIQEDVRRDGDRIELGTNLDLSSHVRPIGADFREGAKFAAGRRLRAADLSLLAAMNAARLVVARRPVVALVATGDELVMPGQTPGPDQIVASNTFTLAEIARAEGAIVRVLPIARDTFASLKLCFDLASDADLIVTSGGASVGDLDLVKPVAEEMGLETGFYKVAMRPGKPLMAGRMGRSMLLGLPGNPVSSIVCAHVFMRPVLRAMQGLPAEPLACQQAPLAAGIGENGPREHYMRASLREDGRLLVAPRQDSALLSVLAEADALVVRPPLDRARGAGEIVEYISI